MINLGRHEQSFPRQTNLRADLSERDWDAMLASFGGHPLQSSLWGASRGLSQRCFALFEEDGQPVWMARVEERRVPLLGRVAWVPKGPSAAQPTLALARPPMAVLERLRAEGYQMLVTNPYVPTKDDARPAGRSIGTGARTIWIDLSRGTEDTFARLNKKWRNGVRRAAKEGVIVAETRAVQDVSTFITLCQGISRTKGFALNLSPEVVLQLLRRDDENARARLFLAKHGSQLLAGALVMIVGRNWHYFWGGSIREMSHMRAGEAVQWAVIEAAIQAGGALYDLEGVDDATNPGTAAFKRKMGGEEISLPGHYAHPLGLRGRAVTLGLALRDLAK